MLALHGRRVFLCCMPVDMRKSFDGLSALVITGLGCDPRSGDAFVFVGKRGNLLKMLIWDRDGFWCCAKRLARGRFRLPRLSGADGSLCAVGLSPSDWELLLEGVVVERSRRLPRWDPETSLTTPVGA